MITFIFQNWAILHALALPNSMQLCEQLHYRFASVRQVYTFARFCHERGIVLHFVAEPYLDMGNGKQWRLAVAKVIASMVESEPCSSIPV